jgi:hypothetical protein|tara:strand:+ start:841 stop:1194 length:354 start_codon:yes stop_codon:yes gene_type:complete
MKNVEAIMKYVHRALENSDISDLQVAYEIITENERRDAEDIQQLTERPSEIDDFEQDIEFAKRQEEKELQKIIKKTKTSKTSDLSAGGVSLPKPTKRIKRKKGARVNVGALLASRGR